MKIPAIIIFSFFFLSVKAQDSCNCLQNLDSVIGKVTRNYAGYNDKVNEKTKIFYAKLTDSLRSAAPANSKDSDCYRILKRYTRFFNDGHLGISLLKKSNKPAAGNTAATSSADAYLPSVSFPKQNWAVITIPSFSVEYNDTIHTLFSHYKKELESRSNWIIDIRGNDGGSRDCYAPLMPYLYTNPVIEYGAATWCSPDNVKAARENFEDYKNQVDTATRNGWVKSIEKMEANVGGWIHGSDDTMRFDAVLQYPKQVAVLIDDNCASSAEIFVLKAKQSKKVKLFGTHTNGTVDYGDVDYWDDLPYHPFNLRIATARWNWIDTLGPIDPNGIIADKMIPSSVSDQINYILARFKK